MKHAVHFSSASVKHNTPRSLYSELDSEFHFDLDPCPAAWKQGDPDGLSLSWKGRRVFCNPPYGPPVYAWLSHASEADIAVYLLPARTDTKWFHEICLPSAKEIRFVRGRLKFNDVKDAAPFPSILVIFERKDSRAIPHSSPGMNRALSS